MKRFFFLFWIAFVPLLSSCVVEKIEPTEANIDLFVAVEYKRSECGSVPPIPLFVMDELEKNALAGCVIAIMSAPCPMTEYPLICVRMYGQNLPGAVDLQDAFVP
ncbi:MAG: hypothetical protein F9K24_00635 [Leptonema illini]|jgi:hypothetical protein|uniref:Lipoprotein n=1 Tax=Leptonema illini TaxID=183 RepID=A0A833H4P4_9LEPT|nr:MAG: hypothetical protein F9K24_00635 [Leptonema illini]